MRVTYEELQTTLRNTPKKRVKQVLRNIFKDPANIDTFAYYMFPYAIKKTTPQFHYEIYDFLLTNNDEAIAAPRGFAKAQSLKSKVLTPKGWVKIKDLNTNDEIFTSNGTITTIKSLQPIQEMDLYQVSTRDGKKALCNKEHLFKVSCPQNTGNKQIIKPLKDIIKNYKTIRIDKRTNKRFKENKYFIEQCKPIQFKNVDLPIDPYTLGAWLGDGHSAGSRFTTADPEITTFFPYECVKVKNNKYGYQFHGLFKLLRENDLLNNKRIPEIYFVGSIVQRTRLLQGLIDTDGTIEQHGKHFSFCNKNESLIDSTLDLVRSLGGTGTKSKQITYCNNKPFVSFRISCRIMGITPCRLSRKKKLWKGSIKTKTAITDIRFIKRGLGRCITINDDSGLYITDDYMVTHNSTIVGLFFLTWCIVNKKKKYIIYMSQNHEKTVQFLAPIRYEFKDNKRLRFIYGDLTPKSVEGDDDDKDREDLIDVGGVKVQAVSFNKNIRGFKTKKNERPDLIIGDDIDDDERVLNPDSRYKDNAKLTKQVIPSLSNEAGAAFKMIGTIIHYDSLLMKTINKCKGKIYRACKVVDGEIQSDGLLWSEYWSKQRLIEEKQKIGSVAFSSEYLNNPIENEASLIKHEWLKACFDENISYGDEHKGTQYLGVDFAFGDRVTNDESAFLALTITDDYKVLNYLEYRRGMSITEQFVHINKQNAMHHYDCCVMEENSIRSMSKELYNYDFPYYLIWTGSSDTAAKMTPDKEFQDKRHTVSKTNMIKRLAVEFENTNIKLPYKTQEDKELTNKLCDELLTFALQDGKLVEVGIHADGPIALSMILEKHNLNNFILDW